MWTHDSVGLGEDGPTHQPIEHYAALRAIPHLWVMRPADANETAVAWRVALEREDGPVALLLSRQNIAVLDRAEVAPRRRARARRLRAVGLPAATRPSPQLILISTGAEVGADARGRPHARRRRATRARVVSMPCMELFEAQPEDYRERGAAARGRARGWRSSRARA